MKLKQLITLVAFFSTAPAFAQNVACEAKARVHLEEYYSVDLSGPALVNDIFNGQPRIAFDQGSCIYTVSFTDASCDKATETQLTCL